MKIENNFKKIFLVE